MDPENRRKAVALAMAGVDWGIIAEQCHYVSPDAAVEDVFSAITPTGMEQSLTTADLRNLQVARLSRLMSAAWPKAVKGDNRSIEVSTRVIKQLCDLQGISDAVIDTPKRDAIETSAYDELARRRSRGTPSGPRRQAGRRRHGGKQPGA